MDGSPTMPQLQDLQSNDQRKLLDIIDDLRAKGLGMYLDLPQLVVCGEQSSGKSSVLEAISGVPFPRKDTTCTRYATEVILRRSPVDKIRISITPSDSRNATDKQALLSFCKEVYGLKDLEELFPEVEKLILGSDDCSKSFTKDVLRVEIWGPHQPALTIVDLPGFVRSVTKNNSKTDKKMIHELVHGYLKNPQSIILAVVSAKNEIENQGVLDEVRKFDEYGNRVLGIITKPDTVTRGSNNETAYLSLARNENVTFNLGWHIIRNLDENERSSPDSSSSPLDRDAMEAVFFETSSFQLIPTSRRGIVSLRKRLSNLLFEKVKENLPSLAKSLDVQIQACKSELEKLGPSRTTTEDQRAYLVELSTELYRLCSDAINGFYDNPFFQNEESENRRLCAVIAAQNLEFAADLEKNGMQWKILFTPALFQNPNERTRSEAIAHCRDLLVKTRGSELPGLPNPLLIRELFCEYNRPWAIKARDHVEASWSVARNFVYEALQQKAGQRVADAYFDHKLASCMAELLERANSSLDELLAVHKGHPFTVNSEFCRELQMAEARRLTRQLVPSIMEFADQKNKPLEEKALESFIIGKISAITKENMDLAAAESALDAMLAYYQIALKSFIDNVPSLAISAKILLELPLLFRASDILRMDDTLLNAIAGESEDLSERRKVLQSKLKTLNEGAAICRRHKAHASSATKRNTPPQSFAPIPSLFATPGIFKAGPQLQNSKSPSLFASTPIRMPSPTPLASKFDLRTVKNNTPVGNSSFGGKPANDGLFGDIKSGSPVVNSTGGDVKTGGIFRGISSGKVENGSLFDGSFGRVKEVVA